MVLSFLLCSACVVGGEGTRGEGTEKQSHSQFTMHLSLEMPPSLRGRSSRGGRPMFLEGGRCSIVVIPRALSTEFSKL